MITLNRFYFTEDNRSGKIRKFIDFPLDNLDMTDHVAGPLKNPMTYDLYSVANHEGSLSSGHYYAFCGLGGEDQEEEITAENKHSKKKEE